jgi:hypothetical protein
MFFNNSFSQLFLCECLNFFKAVPIMLFEVILMMIKNSDYNFNYISHAYTSGGKKPEKPPAAPGTGVSGSAFAGEFNKKTNPSKVDTIEISKPPVNSQATLPAVRDQISSELREDKDAAYLADLKEQINANKYPVNLNEVAGILIFNK